MRSGERDERGVTIERSHFGNLLMDVVVRCYVLFAQAW
jgi:hypothetical protein